MTYDWETEHAKRTSWGVWPAEYMVRALARYEGQREAALDVGSGGGAHVRLLQESGFHNVWAQDISQTAVDRIKTMAKDPQLVACGDINQMIYAPGEFDVIIDNLSTTHAESVDWRRIWSWLQPGGMLITAQFVSGGRGFPSSWYHQLPTYCGIPRHERIAHDRLGGDGYSIIYTVDVAIHHKDNLL